MTIEKITYEAVPGKDAITRNYENGTCTECGDPPEEHNRFGGCNPRSIDEKEDEDYENAWDDDDE